MDRLVRWPGGQVGPKVPRLKKVLFCAAISPGHLMESDLATAGLRWTTTLRDHSTRRIFFVKSILAVANIYIPVLISFLPSLL